MGLENIEIHEYLVKFYMKNGDEFSGITKSTVPKSEYLGKVYINDILSQKWFTIEDAGMDNSLLTINVSEIATIRLIFLK